MSTNHVPIHHIGHQSYRVYTIFGHIVFQIQSQMQITTVSIQE